MIVNPGPGAAVDCRLPDRGFCGTFPNGEFTAL